MPAAKNPQQSKFSAPHFQSVEAARTYLEDLRWGTERVCPHCGTVNASFATKKPGVYRCSSKDVPQGFQRHHQERHGKQPYQAARLASGFLPHGLSKEGH